MIIRKANSDDIQNILSLYKKNSFSKLKDSLIKDGFVRIPLDAKALETIIEQEYAAVCIINNKLAGYYLFAGEGENNYSKYLREVIIEYTDIIQEDVLFGTQACVDNDYRKQGIGSLLFSFIISTVPCHKKYMFGSVTKQNVVGYEFSVTKMGGKVIFEDSERFFVLFKIEKLISAMANKN